MFILKGKDFEKVTEKLNVSYWIVTDEETEGELVYDSLGAEEFCFRLYEDYEVEDLRVANRVESHDNSLFDIEKKYVVNDELVIVISCDLTKEEYFYECELQEDKKKRKNIKWNENKKDNYRGNFTKKSFKFNNSDKTFYLDTIVSYKSLKQYLKEISELVGANEITILNEIPKDAISINFHYDNDGKLILKFKREIDVEEGCKREFGYYDKSVLFNKQK
ncbi:hypothetical protein E1H24_02070 [Clostridioides difficile]|uniref:hypothetical protein n=1 Tax=Clostridioides difficile TaxID=1496 RepID=UPI00093F49BE|nr:hypothetical protein [Clostridioides difficile]EGT4823064.1 hypothetical protein [Clostridioides difficile]EGT5245305.1 hypothetical protein [Clostridioides difficile]EII6832793.1 hypothetical protein [Clostridioides difficile]EJA6610261.1 hypothetical protein [Clostridioides difficile]EKS6798217.1 hypothetical protein [Clostridioides difficile]